MTTIVDGKEIQADIKGRLQEEIQKQEARPHLTLVYIGENPVIDTYVELKRSFGEDIGVHVNVERFPSELSFERVQGALQAYNETDADGIVVQLPLPDHLPTQKVLDYIPQEKDVDVLSEEAFNASLAGVHPLPPVVGAVSEIFERHDVSLKGKRVVVVGKGRLVGKPLSLWLLSQGVPPVLLEKGDDLSVLENADVVISGAGSAHLISPEMVKEGAVVIDAGTSDVGGETKGDIHPDVAEKSSLFAGVPGGVGPITIAKLFENVVLQAQKNTEKA